MIKKLKSPHSKEVYERNAKIYRFMANPKRLEILNILRGGEACVDDLAEAIGVHKANVSQHLSIMRYLRLVKVRRSGKNHFYSLTDPRLVTVCRTLKKLWSRVEV